MILFWRRPRAARRARKKNQPEDNSGMELTIPNHFRCPISLDLMKDPVTLSTGITYDRQSIETWIESGNHTCPITNQTLRSLEPIPNHTVRKMIQEWCVQNRSFGVERIPTPRTPVTSLEVSEILSKVAVARRREDSEGCVELVAKIKGLVKENERNRRCILASGTGGALSETFEAFSEGSYERNGAVLGEILSTLTLVFPLDEEAGFHLGSSSSMNSMVWFLKTGDLSARRNAVLVIKEVVSSDQNKANTLVEIEGAMDGLFNLMKEPICPTTTKASLTTIYNMISLNEKAMERFIEMGMVSFLLEVLVECDRSVCERALVVLDGLCSCVEGREKAYAHALTMPVLVKKLLRVSDFATDFSVSILWRLSKNEKREEDEGGVLVEALQVGAFQKLLLLLQVGCGEKTKEQASKLLKLLNVQRDRLECIDSTDFKDLKRPF